VKPDAATETELLEVLERFCSAFADRDAEALMRLFVPDPDVVVITSEEPFTRGSGSATTSRQLGRSHGSSPRAPRPPRARADSQQHPYRMTMVLEHHENHWLLRQVHGSSPHRAAPRTGQRKATSTAAPAPDDRGT
jgi:ketosteroid isomerase-like protein